MITKEINVLNKKAICFSCVKEYYLQSKIRKGGTKKLCDYCGNFSQCYLVKNLAKKIKKAFTQHFEQFEPTSTQEMLLQKGIEDWTIDCKSVDRAIKDAAIIPDDAARDVQKILQDKFANNEFNGLRTEFDNESYYREKDLAEYFDIEEWDDIEHKIKFKSRYFNYGLRDFLSELFSNIDKIQTKNDSPVVIAAGPEEQFNSVFRARMFQSEEMLKKAIIQPDVELGPPPSHLAKAGRANAQGVSVFYGATKPEVAIDEVRPPVGSLVAVVEFKIIRQLRLLDLKTLKDSWATGGSIFNQDFATQLKYAAFLCNLWELFGTPIMPEDEQFDYLTTQAIADFLASETVDTIDGIIYPSSQTAFSECQSSNIVLFHKSAKVKPMVILEREEIEACIDRNEENDFEVSYSRNIRSSIVSNDPDEEIPIDPLNRDIQEKDCREPSLCIVKDNLFVHKVLSVQIETDRNKVDHNNGSSDPYYFLQ